MDKIRLTNVADDETFSYSTVLIRGLVDGAVGTDLTLKHYSNNGKQLAETRWTVRENRFKVIVQLKLGDNTLVFKFADQVLRTRFVYERRNTDYTVCPVYVICADHDGRFQVPNDVQKGRLNKGPRERISQTLHKYPHIFHKSKKMYKP